MKQLRNIAVLFMLLIILVSALPTSTMAASRAREIGPDGRSFPSGGLRVGDSVVYENGDIVLQFAPQGLQAASLFGPRCPDGWFCLFEHINWGGRMLKFRNAGAYQYLSNYGFQNQASSWHNRHGRSVRVYDYRVGLLWCADPNAKSSWVGSYANDKADYIRVSFNNDC